jgi:hypothetical protein
MARISRRAVRSTCLRSAGHDPKTKRLEVEFRKSGAVYAYDGVPKRKADRLVAAASVGRTYNKTIKHEYPYTRLRRATPKRGAKKHR